MTTPTPAIDQRDRPLRNLRVSVTDRCNLRCNYCMPEQEYTWLPREDILTFEEIDLLVGGFVRVGVDRVRLTGGEPLIRKNLPDLVARIARYPEIRDVAMTTNGLLFPDQGEALRRAGLRRVTVSLDSLDRARYAKLSSRDELAAARAGIECASGLDFDALKINTVVIRGENDGEIPALIEYGRSLGAEVRFIEYMDVGGATGWQGHLVVSRDEILARVAEHFGAAEPVQEQGSAPARRWRLADGTVFGIIASTTAPFCGSCDRSRLTADGVWYTCLYSRTGQDLRALVRDGASVDELADRLRTGWTGRNDRGAEERLGLADRGAMAEKAELDSDPHLEMHTRGG